MKSSKKDKSIMREILDGVMSWRIWLLLGWQDIRLRYRRSQLGPFWITLSMAISIYTMGFLYGHIFHMELKSYFPFLASGLLIWTLLSTIINESTNALIDATGYLKQMKIPFLVFILRVVIRNIIIFLHNLIAIIPVMIWAHIAIGWHTLAIVFGLFMIILNGTTYGFILSMLGARFRDIGPVIISSIQVVFFVTPVLWMPKVLPEKYSFVIKYNPFAQFLDLVRAPLIGTWPSVYTLLMTAGFTVLGLTLMVLLFKRTKDRIIYWL